MFFIRKMGPLVFTVQHKVDRLNTVLQENIAGMRVVKSFGRAEYENERFAMIDHGEIVETGSHQELLDRGGLYHYLYVSQFKGQAI